MSGNFKEECWPLHSNIDFTVNQIKSNEPSLSESCPDRGGKSMVGKEWKETSHENECALQQLLGELHK